MTLENLGMGSGQPSSGPQRLAEDLPGRQKPGREAEHEMTLLAVRVVAPPADLAVLEPLPLSRLWEADDAAMTIPHTKLGTVLDLMMSTQNRIRINGGEADERPEPKGEPGG